MGTRIPDEGGGAFAPTAEIKEKGAMFKGVLTGMRLLPTKYGPRPVYTFKVEDADCKFVTGKERAEAFPAEGDTVEIWAPTRLARQLSKVQNGQSVTIKYVGTKKVGRGNPAHVFDVEVN
jgi:hypothetical protein